MNVLMTSMISLDSCGFVCGRTRPRVCAFPYISLPLPLDRRDMLPALGSYLGEENSSCQRGTAFEIEYLFQHNRLTLTVKQKGDSADCLN